MPGWLDRSWERPFAGVLTLPAFLPQDAQHRLERLRQQQPSSAAADSELQVRGAAWNAACPGQALAR